MNKGGGTIVMIALGVGAIYLGATGHLDSFWRGLTGNCAAASTGDDAGTPPATGGQADWRNSNTALMQGGERVHTGHYYPGPNGLLFVSDAGTY